MFLSIAAELVITNESGRRVNGRLTMTPPFVIITKDLNYVDKINLPLPNGQPTSVLTYFPFDLKKSKIETQIYKGSLKFEYDEHPNVVR